MPRYIDVEDFWKAMTTRFDSCADLGEISEVLDSMPTVSPDAARCAGKWIHFTRKYISGVDDEGVPMIRCSVCDYTQFESSRSSTNYCPSCGAKMEVTSDA